MIAVSVINAYGLALSGKAKRQAEPDPNFDGKHMPPPAALGALGIAIG